MPCGIYISLTGYINPVLDIYIYLAGFINPVLDIYIYLAGFINPVVDLYIPCWIYKYHFIILILRHMAAHNMWGQEVYHFIEGTGFRAARGAQS